MGFTVIAVESQIKKKKRIFCFGNEAICSIRKNFIENCKHLLLNEAQDSFLGCVRPEKSW